MCTCHRVDQCRKPQEHSGVGRSIGPRSAGPDGPSRTTTVTPGVVSHGLSLASDDSCEHKPRMVSPCMHTLGCAREVGGVEGEEVHVFKCREELFDSRGTHRTGIGAVCPLIEARKGDLAGAVQSDTVGRASAEA